MKRLTMVLTVLLGGCLAGCPAIPAGLCPEEPNLHLASDADLIGELVGRGFEDLGGLFGGDD